MARSQAVRSRRLARSLVVLNVNLFELALEILRKVIHHSFVKVFVAQMSIAYGCLHLEIPSSMVRRETSTVPTPRSKMSALLIETVGNGSCSGLVER